MEQNAKHRDLPNHLFYQRGDVYMYAQRTVVQLIVVHIS